MANSNIAEESIAWLMEDRDHWKQGRVVNTCGVKSSYQELDYNEPLNQLIPAALPE